ncbi:MAG: hypothetical protein U9R72_10090 [Chloroflexota bacterium]|nr:hypothetical protein [Chloroflexota bacterium]
MGNSAAGSYYFSRREDILELYKAWLYGCRRAGRLGASPTLGPGATDALGLVILGRMLAWWR